MFIERIPPKRYPRVELERRAAAFAIDFLVVWFLSSILGASSLGIQIAQVLVFVIGWLAMRVLLVYNNQGQSLGRWALDMKLLDVERGRVPGLQFLLKREGITGLEALLVAIALTNLRANPTAVVLAIPLAIDFGAAFANNELRQTLHDRYARTTIVSSQRGYSLDIKAKRWLDILQRKVRR